jgi:hypothetical protein
MARLFDARASFVSENHLFSAFGDVYDLLES